MLTKFEQNVNLILKIVEAFFEFMKANIHELKNNKTPYRKNTESVV